MDNSIISLSEDSPLYFSSPEVVGRNTNFISIEKMTGKLTMFTATKPTANMLPPFKTNQVQIKLKERASSRFSIYTPTITGNSLKTYGYFSNSTTTDITFNI